MTPGQQQRKNLQDEARRQQQGEEKIRELEQEVKRLRSALTSAHTALNDTEQWFYADAYGIDPKDQISPQKALDVVQDIREQSDAGHDALKRALNGGGDQDE